MSEVAKLIENGVICCKCGNLINLKDLKGPGYERLCRSCKKKSLTSS